MALSFLEALYSGRVTSSALDAVHSSGLELLRDTFDSQDNHSRDRSHAAPTEVRSLLLRGSEADRFAGMRGITGVRGLKVYAHWSVPTQGGSRQWCTHWAETFIDEFTGPEDADLLIVVIGGTQNESERGVRSTDSPPIVVMRRDGDRGWRVAGLINTQIGI